jgi:hypothetical protein
VIVHKQNEGTLFFHPKSTQLGLSAPRHNRSLHFAPRDAAVALGQSSITSGLKSYTPVPYLVLMHHFFT